MAHSTGKLRIRQAKTGSTYYNFMWKFNGKRLHERMRKRSQNTEKELGKIKL
jgi:hypothetical protein